MSTQTGPAATVVRAPGARTREATIPKTIRTRINQLAHHCALRHEAQVKAALLEQMQHLATGGADLAAMARTMDGHEAQEGLTP